MLLSCFLGAYLALLLILRFSFFPSPFRFPPSSLHPLFVLCPLAFFFSLFPSAPSLPSLSRLTAHYEDLKFSGFMVSVLNF